MLPYNVSEGLAAKMADNYARAVGGIGPDYDYSKAGNVGANGHFTDAGKLPNHPTFSVESSYSNAQTPGGVWNNMISPEGKIVQTYTPSIQMMQQPGRAEGLARYMAEVEPKAVLMYPAPYKQPSYDAQRVSLATPEGQAYANKVVEDFRAADKGLKEASDIIALPVAAVGPAVRSLQNAIGNMLRKRVDPGLGAFVYEQALEEAVQNQLEER